MSLVVWSAVLSVCGSLIFKAFFSLSCDMVFLDILGNKTHCKYIHKPYLCHLCIFSALLMNSSRILSLVA